MVSSERQTPLHQDADMPQATGGMANVIHSRMHGQFRCVENLLTPEQSHTKLLGSTA